MDLRVNGTASMLPMSAAIVTAGILTPTGLATVATLTRISAVAVIRSAARSDVDHRTVRCRCVNHPRREIPHRRRAVNDGWQTTRCGHHDGRRVPDWSREGEAQRPTRLRRGGEPSSGNHCYQTEEMFCLHERFDCLFKGFFIGRKM